MRNLMKLLTVILFIGLISSCESNDDALLNENENSILNSKKEVLALNSRASVTALNLDAKFNINKDVYNEFIESLTFENGEFVGAIYDRIEKELDEKSSNEFWGEFGISIHDNNRNLTTNTTIFEGYKPRRGGCKANNRWICVIREY